MTPRKQHESPLPGGSAEHAALPERRASLWKLIGGPTVWAAHFLLSYVTAAIWCAKSVVVAAPLGNARIALAAYTVVALIAIAALGWRGWRQHRWGSASLPHAAASAADRHRFLGFATMLLCGLSFVAVVYMAIAMSVIGTCR